ncbi:hypothetical protein LshimejAT787_0305140 [Lyophyllum shimeji]|uniref:Pre-rRNA-processing protein n=1 Tax=Lyophyllum shimeji TaxID=47721 RepID=A0A9P3PIW1_LYOSH|nr:hypothetical protein LshimejAT787_0305140 [Lyophyllum shimeji]
MPKSAKKRKDKAADFSKAKLKLGKGKQLPSNAIDTSFKARSIALPSQSIAHEKDASVPTTKRRLTLEDLITHTRHYSASTRKDAILGLRELFEANWDLVESSFTALINACVRLIGDEDANVRKALLAFFAWLLPRMPQSDLLPHSPLLLLFTASAQTHIFPEIRIDAIRFLDLFLECIPQAVVAGWSEDNNGHGARILEGYLGILNAGTKFGETDGPLKATSTASVVLTPASKLIVLHSLATFLQVSLSCFAGPSSSTSYDPSSLLRAWYLASSFARQADYRSFEELLRPSPPGSRGHRIWQEVVDQEERDDDVPHDRSTRALFSGDQFSLQELEEISNVIKTSDFYDTDGLDTSFVAHLARTLHSTLIATFLDCAPAVFSPSASPSETQVRLVLAVGQITRSLYGVILQNPASAKGSCSATAEDLRVLLGYMMPYFPFRHSGNRDIKIEQAFEDLNLIFCELTSLLVLATNAESIGPRRQGKLRQINQELSTGNGPKGVLSMQVQGVSEYILQLLRSEPVAGSQVGRALTVGAYVALLPAIWMLLNGASAQHQRISSAVLHATIEHSIKTSSKSALKRLTIEFVARLVLLSTVPGYHGSLRSGRDPGEDKKLEDWVVHLPQPLWEFGANNLPGSEIILRFLLRLLQRRSKIIHSSATVASLRSKLIPYFTIAHPVRGQVPGPYSKLPVASPLRRLALDLVAILMSAESGREDGLGAAVDQATMGTEEQEYWVEIQRLS